MAQAAFDFDEPGQGASVGAGRSKAAGQAKLMAAFDAVKRRFGRGSLQLAGVGALTSMRGWGMWQERRTPCFTTSWADMPIAQA